MLVYSVHIYIKKENATEWIDWMIQTHIPDVMRTKCFNGTQISDILDPQKQGYKGFIIQYNTTEKRLAKYQNEFAAALQADHQKRYNGLYLASRFVSQTLRK